MRLKSAKRKIGKICFFKPKYQFQILKNFEIRGRKIVLSPDNHINFINRLNATMFISSV